MNIIKSIEELFFKVTDNYLVNEINSNDLKYIEYKFYRYHRYFMVFNVPQLIGEYDSVRHRNILALWLIEHGSNIKHRKYTK